MSSKKVIIGACEKGDLPQLQHVLEETELDVGSEPLGSEGETALHVACAHGHLDIVQYLVNDRGCDPTAMSYHGTTPLQVAWQNKCWMVASYVLQAMREHPGHVSGLSSTAITQLLELVDFGEDAFCVACSCGDLEVVQYLHESLKCSLTRQNAQGKTPFDMARLNGQLQIIHFLFKRGKCSAPDMTELHIASMGRRKTKVRSLASDIKSLSISDQYGITAVHYATFQPENLSILVSIAEQRNMLSLLVRQDERGNTPLHYAASCGRTKSVQILVSYCKSVNIQNSDGDTPLHLSIKSSYCSYNLV